MGTAKRDAMDATVTTKASRGRSPTTPKKMAGAVTNASFGASYMWFLAVELRIG
jgi:hypothetical protein